MISSVMCVRFIIKETYTEWFETFFNGLFKEIMRCDFSSTSDGTQVYVDIIVRALELQEGQRVLDIPCGRGRIAVPLAKMGINVVGVDFMRSYLAALRRCASREGVFIKCFQLDMREIEFEDEFDAAFNFGGSFGYFDDHGDQEFLRRVFKSIRSGGKFLIEIPNRVLILRKFVDSYHQEVGRVHVFIRNHFDRATGRMESTWVMTEKNKQDKEIRHISMRLYKCMELRRLLKQIGFSSATFYAYPPLRPYDQTTFRVIAVATKD